MPVLIMRREKLLMRVSAFSLPVFVTSTLVAMGDRVAYQAKGGKSVIGAWFGVLCIKKKPPKTVGWLLVRRTLLMRGKDVSCRKPDGYRFAASPQNIVPCVLVIHCCPKVMVGVKTPPPLST